MLCLLAAPTWAAWYGMLSSTDIKDALAALPEANDDNHDVLAAPYFCGSATSPSTLACRALVAHWAPLRAAGARVDHRHESVF